MKSLKNIKRGQQIAYKNIGFGLVSYEEPDEVISVSRTKGKIFTSTFEREGMQWDGRKGVWFFDGGLGMRTEGIHPDDVPDGAYEQ